MFQKISYPEKTDKVLMNIDDTMTSCSVRQAVGSILGGANFTSSWGTYIVGIDCQTPHSGRCGFNGGFMYYRRVVGLSDGLGDLAAGIERSLDRRRMLTAFGSGHGNDAQRQNHPIRRHRGVLFRLVNPVFGWALTMLLDNLGLIGCKERSAQLGFVGRVLIPAVGFLILCVAMGAVGMLPGIPPFLEQFKSLG